MSSQEIVFDKVDNTGAKPVMFRKFGGSSFKPMSNVVSIAQEVLANVDKGIKQVVFCSAPGGLTDSFKEMAGEVGALALSPAMDGLTMSSDLVGAQLLQHALLAEGRKVKILDGRSNGILTDDNTGGSRVISVNAEKLFAELEDADICVLPGGQGASADGQWRWLGKNSSDLSCVLLAIAGNADTCGIHSDVDSVYSADPNVISEAVPFGTIDYDTLVTAARLGAKVLHPNAVLCAQRNNVEIQCKLNKAPFNTGTTIGNYNSQTMVVTDKKAQLLTVATEHISTVMQGIDDMLVTAYSSEELEFLAPGQVLIPMAYSDYGAFLQKRYPQLDIDVAQVNAVHVVSGKEVKQSCLVAEGELAEVASAFHRDFVNSVS